MTGPRDQTLSARARIQRTGEAYKTETCLQLAKYLVKLLAAYSYNYILTSFCVLGPVSSQLVFEVTKNYGIYIGRFWLKDITLKECSAGKFYQVTL